MNGIVSGKVDSIVNQLANFGEVKMFDVSTPLLSNFWKNTTATITTNGFAMPIGFTYAYCDTAYYQSYKPTCYMTVAGNSYYDPCQNITIRLEAPTAQQSGYGGTLTFRGLYLEFNENFEFTIQSTQLQMLTRYTITF